MYVSLLGREFFWGGDQYQFCPYSEGGIPEESYVKLLKKDFSL